MGSFGIGSRFGVPSDPCTFLVWGLVGDSRQWRWGFTPSPTLPLEGGGSNKQP